MVAAKTLKCDVCDERKQPKTRRPATLPSVKDVGAQAHIDLLVVEDAFKQSFYVVHVTDKVLDPAHSRMNDKSNPTLALYPRWFGMKEKD